MGWEEEMAAMMGDGSPSGSASFSDMGGDDSPSPARPLKPSSNARTGIGSVGSVGMSSTGSGAGKKRTGGLFSQHWLFAGCSFLSAFCRFRLCIGWWRRLRDSAACLWYNCCTSWVWSEYGRIRWRKTTRSTWHEESGWGSGGPGGWYPQRSTFGAES